VSQSKIAHQDQDTMKGSKTLAQQKEVGLGRTILNCLNLIRQMVDWLTVAADEWQERQSLILNGRAWDIREIDFSGRKIFVSPSSGRGKARWYGQGQGLSFELAQQVKEVLLSEELSGRWSKRCEKQMTALREEYIELGVGCEPCFHDPSSKQMIWWSFAGRFLNESLASLLASRAVLEAKFDDFNLRFSQDRDASQVTASIQEVICEPQIIERLPISTQWLDGLKFSQCLPEKFALAAARGRIRLGNDVLGPDGRLARDLER
jgi:ATP-dependent Lhr-like helicase|tara:strand:- start:62 stop:850 length:789 start_codon:yes stop_codon:yes gene_type:complete